jgi:hypothetical protein
MGTALDRDSAGRMHKEEPVMSARMGQLSAGTLLLMLTLVAGCEDKGGYIAEPGDVTPPGRVNSLEAIDWGDSTVMLRWLAPWDDPGTGVAAKYEIRYQRGELALPWWESATPIVEMESTAAYFGLVETATVSGLEPYETYQFALKAADEVPNWSEVSNVAEIYVPPVIPPDVSGRWAGTAYCLYDFYPWWDEVSLDLTQSDETVTGTYEWEGFSGSLHSGDCRGGRIVLVIRAPSLDADYVLTGTLEKDHIDGEYFLQVISTGEILYQCPWYADRTG